MCFSRAWNLLVRGWSADMGRPLPGTVRRPPIHQNPARPRSGLRGAAGPGCSRPHLPGAAGPLDTRLRVRDPGAMRMRLAVAVIVAAVLAGVEGIVAEASLRVPVGVAQPQAWVLAGLLPLLVTGAALS